MLIKIALLLTVVPIVELYLLFRIAGWTSVGFTILLIITTGIVGAFLARMEGLRVLNKIQKELHEQNLPADSLLDGLMVLVAGAFLLTPGVLTDTFGFLMLVPFTRSAIRVLLKNWLRRKIQNGQIQMYKDAGFGPLQEEPPPGYPPVEQDEHTEDNGE
ncbi:MAG: FxsA family protein [Planctomycetes bacterium]|nr:FxsA family protein [Planctomycetota bacterium]